MLQRASPVTCRTLIPLSMHTAHILPIYALIQATLQVAGMCPCVSSPLSCLGLFVFPSWNRCFISLLLCFRLLRVSRRCASGIKVCPGGVSGSGRFRSRSSACLRHSSFLSSRLGAKESRCQHIWHRQRPGMCPSNPTRFHVTG